MPASEVKIKISVDNNTGELKAINDDLAKFGKTADSSGSKIKSAVDFTAHFGQAFSFVKAGFDSAATGAKSFIDAAAEFETLKATLKTLEGSAAGAEKSFAWVQEFGAKTPYELTDVTEAFIRMKAYGIDPTNGTLKTLGDTASAMNKPIMQAVEAMADAMTGENERLKEFGITAKTEGDKIQYNWIDSSGEARSTVIDNNSKIIESTLSAIFNEKYEGAMDDQMQTFSGLTSNMSDNWMVFKDKVAQESGLFDIAKEAIKSFNQNFGAVSNNQVLINALGMGVVGMAEMALTAVEWIIKPFQGWAYIIKGVETGAINLGVTAGAVYNEAAKAMYGIYKVYLENNPFEDNKEEEIAKINAAIAGLNSETKYLKDYQESANQKYREFVSGQEAVSAAIRSTKDGITKAKESYSKSAEDGIKDSKKLKDEIAKNDKSVTDTKENELKKRSEADKKAHENTKKLSGDTKKATEKDTKDTTKEIVKLWDDAEDSLDDNFSDIEKSWKEYANKYNPHLSTVATNITTTVDDDIKTPLDGAFGYISTAWQNNADTWDTNLKTDATNIETTADDDIKTPLGTSFGAIATSWSNYQAGWKQAVEDDAPTMLSTLDTEVAQEYKDSFGGIASTFKTKADEWYGYFDEAYKLNMESHLSSNLEDVFEGKVTSIGGFFDGLWSDIYSELVKTTTKIAAKKIILGFSNAWSGNPNTGQGDIESMLGFDIPFLKFAQGTVWGGGKYGVVEGAKVPYDSYDNDTVPALISRGEAIIPASSVAANWELVNALINSRGAPQYAHGGIIGQDGIPRYFLGGIGDAIGNVFGGISGGISNALGSVGNFFGDAWKGISGVAGSVWGGATSALGSVAKTIMPALAPIMKEKWLGWAIQAALALNPGTAWLIPSMLTADLVSAGISVGTGQDLGAALGSAGWSGAIAGATAGVGGLINGVPAQQMSAMQYLQNYPSDMANKLMTNYDSVTSFLSNLTQPYELADPALFAQTTDFSSYAKALNLNDVVISGKGGGVMSAASLAQSSAASNPTAYTNWAKGVAADSYANFGTSTFNNATQFGNNGQFLSYSGAYGSNQWGLPSYQDLLKPATNFTLENAKDYLSSGIDYAKTLGSDALDYMANPEKIASKILNEVPNIISKVLTTISGVTANPELVGILGGNALYKKLSPDTESKVHAFANGGIVTAPTIGLVGEAGYSEAVIPLNKNGADAIGITQLSTQLKNIESIMIALLAEFRLLRKLQEEVALI